MPAIDPGEELVEVVDATGTVVDVVPRRRIRSENLRHRCTYVAVVTGARIERSSVRLSAGAQLVVHRRADWKDVFPSHWDVAFGGICGLGEDWLVSARRELAEEAGLTGVPLIELGLSQYEDEVTAVRGMVYVAALPDDRLGELTPVNGEVVAIDRVAVDGLPDWLRSHPVCTDSAEIVVPRLLALRP